MKFPVWQTTLEVFDYLWRERRALVRFGLPPVATLFLLSVLLQLVLGENEANVQIAQGIVGIVQVVIFLPVTVTWYRMAVIGEAEARTRPLFSFGREEARLLKWQVAILAIVLVIAGVCSAVTILLNNYSQEDNSGIVMLVNIIWSIAWLFSLLVLMTRLSMVLVLAALDQPVSLKAAWQMTKGISLRLLNATALIAVAGFLVGGVFKLLGSIVSEITPVTTASVLDEILKALDALGQTVGGLITLLGVATLFGFVYLKLTGHTAAETPAAPIEP